MIVPLIGLGWWINCMRATVVLPRWRLWHGMQYVWWWPCIDGDLEESEAMHSMSGVSGESSGCPHSTHGSGHRSHGWGCTWTMLLPSCSQMNGGTLDELCNFACEDEEHLLLPLDYRSSWWPTMPRVLPVQNSNSLCRVMGCTTIGLAEWPVQTFKSGMKNLTEGTLETRLSWFLFHYCTTPDATTGQLPEGGMAVQPGWQPIKRAVIAAVVVNRMRSIMNLTLQIAAVMNIELVMWQKQNRAVLRNCTRPVFVLLRSVPRKLRNRPGTRALVKHGSQRGANRSQQLCPKPLFADGRKASQL